jgi:hypothetical protein
MIACPYGKDWDNLVKAVGKFQAYKDYMQFNGEIRSPELVMAKLATQSSMRPVQMKDQYQIGSSENNPSVASVEVLETMCKDLIKKFPEGYAYKLVNAPDKNFKGKVAAPTSPDAIEGKPTIVINTAKAGLDTPIHEFSHIFIHLLRTENIRAYMSLMNSLFNVKTEKRKVTDPNTGVEKEESVIVDYELKDTVNGLAFGEEIKRLKPLYPDYTTEELLEETLAEMLGKYGSNLFNPETGKFREDWKPDEGLLKTLATALTKIWEAIKGILFGEEIKINIQELSPGADIQTLATLISNPKILFTKPEDFTDRVESTSRVSQSSVTSSIQDYQTLKNAILSHPNSKIIYNPRSSKLVYATEDVIEELRNFERRYQDFNNYFYNTDKDPNTKNFVNALSPVVDYILKKYYQTSFTATDRSRLMQEIGSELESRFSNTRFMAIVNVNNTSLHSSAGEKFVQDILNKADYYKRKNWLVANSPSYKFESSARAMAVGYAREFARLNDLAITTTTPGKIVDRTTAITSYQNVLNQIFSGRNTPATSRLFRINTVGRLTTVPTSRASQDYTNRNFNTTGNTLDLSNSQDAASFVSVIDTSIAELQNSVSSVITTPKTSRSHQFIYKIRKPIMVDGKIRYEGDIEEEKINVTGSLNNNEVYVTFSSDVWYMDQPAYLVPATGVKLRKDLSVVIFEKSGKPLYKIGESLLQQNAGMQEHKDKISSSKWSDAMYIVREINGNQVTIEPYGGLSRGATKTVDISELSAVSYFENRSIKVLNGVIDTIYVMYKDVPVDAITFSPISGGGPKRTGNEMRLGSYNDMFKRTFGKWATNTSGNVTKLIVPQFLKNMMTISQDLFQKGDSVSSIDGFEQSTEGSMATVGIEAAKPAISVSQETINNSNGVGTVKAFAKSLAGKLILNNKSFKYQFVTAGEAKRITENTRNPWTGQKAFFVGDTVYFVGDNISMEDVFHEFSHPFVRSLFLDNPKAFWSIYNDILKSEEGQQLYRDVKAAYPELSESDPLFAEEMIVRTLTKAAEMKNFELKPTTGFAKALKNLLYAIKQMLRKFFGQNIKVSKLDSVTSIDDLLSILGESEDVVLNEAVANNVDTVSYIKDFDQYVKDINRISKPELFGITVKAYDIAVKQIDTVLRNKNYREIANILSDQFKRGELDEIKRNLSKFAKPLEDKILAKRDKLQYEKAHAEAMVSTLFRLQNMVGKVKEHLKDLSEDTDSIDNMHKAYYYDYLLRYWSQYIQEVQRTMQESQIDEASPLSNLVGTIERGIKNAEVYTKQMYKTGARDALFNEISPMAKAIDEKYRNIIEKLKRDKAPQNLIELWTQEYYGLTEKEVERRDSLLSQQRLGTITQKGKLELDSLNKKSMDGAQITKEKMEMALNGEFRDSNVFNSFFEGYLYNTDPVVGSFALYVKNQMADVTNIAMQKFNSFASDLKPLLERAGYTPSNVNQLIDKIARVELVGKIDEDGNWVERQVYTLKSAHKDWRIALDRLRRDIDEAQRLYSENNSDQNHKNLIAAIAAKKKLLRDYFYQEYDPKVYARDEVFKKFDGDAVGEEAQYRRDKIFEQMEEISNPLNSMMDDYEISERMEQLWREYHQLYSLVDLNGNMKDVNSMDYKVAMRLKEHRNAAIDPATGESFFDWKPRFGIFESNLEKFEQELAEKYGYPSDEYTFHRANWIAKNTRTVLKKEFYEERARILDEINKIMNKLPDSARKAKRIGQIWTEILDLVAGNRDEDGQPNGMNFSDGGINFIKTRQEELTEAMNEFSGLNGLTPIESQEYQSYWEIINAKERELTDDEQVRFNVLMDKSSNSGLSKTDKKKLFGLFAKLQGLQKKEATDYYVMIMNHHLSKLNTTLMMNELNTNTITKSSANLILDDYIIDPLLEQSEEFKKWFMKNHIRKEIYDTESGTRKSIWERIYAWNVVRPTSDAYYETTTIKKEDGTEEVIKGLPALKYYARVVKPQYRTERIVGKTVDNQGNFLPRTDIADSPFIDKEYLEMSKNDPAHFAVLEKMKEHHLRNQEGLGYKSRLYLDIPRYRKNNLEVLRTKSLRGIAKDVGDEKAPMLQLLIERFKNFFRKAKDEKAGGEYNWEDDAMLVRADMFDNESVSVPISGLTDLDLTDTSPDVTQSLMRYMFSAERQKKLIEISPVAQALKTTVNDPANLTKQLDKINKFNFIHRGIITYLTKKGRYTRQAAVNNFIEREFEGQTDAGFTKDLPFLQNAANMILGRASFAYFAFNFPSAIKNAIGAKWQAMLHAVGGVDTDVPSMARGEMWAANTMFQISNNLYTRGAKPLSMQLADSFDAIRERAEKKLPEGMSRTFAHDLASLSWFSNFRQWTENQAALQLFGAMMYKKQIMRDGKEISYMDAWESIDGQLTLKSGIDVRYGNTPTEYTIQEGDTMESLAKKFNMPVEDLKQELSGVRFVEGKEIKIDNRLYKAFRNKVHAVSANLNGAYAKFDQPEAQRYLAYRMMSYLKRFFIPMFVNRWGYSGTLLGRKRGRVNFGLGDVQEGYYTTTLKVLWRTVEFAGKNWPHLTSEEKASVKKTVIEVIALIALLAVVAPMFGWDPADDERYEKLRQKSGSLPFPWVEEDRDRPFDLGGWMSNHALMMALQVRSENEAFVPWMGFGLDNYYETFTDVSSLGFGPTLETYKDMLELMYMEATGDPRARYKKDSGPYTWQREGGSKWLAEFMKSIGLTGSTLDPAVAVKKNPQFQGSGGGKSKEEKPKD